MPIDLPQEYVDRVVAAPGILLVERDEVSERVGSIWVPESYRSQRATVVATVISAGALSEFAPGDRVILGSGLQRKLTFGERGQTRRYAVYPSEIVAKLGQVERIERGEDHPLGEPPRSPAGDAAIEKRSDGAKVVRP